MITYAIDHMQCLQHETKQAIYDLINSADPGNTQLHGDTDGQHALYRSTGPREWLVAAMDGDGNIEVGRLDDDQLDTLKRHIDIDARIAAEESA